MIQLYGFQVYVQTDSGTWIDQVFRVFSTSVNRALFALEKSLDRRYVDYFIEESWLIYPEEGLVLL